MASGGTGLTLISEWDIHSWLTVKCRTLLSYVRPFWASLHSSELRCTLLSYVAPYWATPHLAELRHTLMQISVARNFRHLLKPESSRPRGYLTRVKQTKVANDIRYFITLANESFRFGWSVLLFYSSNWVSSALSPIGGVHINLILFGGLAISLAYLSGEEGGILLVQMISTCLCCAKWKGGGGVQQHPVLCTDRTTCMHMVWL